MIRRMIFFFIFLLSISICSANQTYYYESFEDDQSAPSDNFTIQIGDLQKGQRVVQWREEEDGFVKYEEYVLDDSWATLQWHVSDAKNKTDYEGRREGKHLILEGMFLGRRIEKKIPIGKEPFYFNPKLGLRSFVESDRKKQEFWAIRHDTLGEFKMVAKKEKREWIEVSGQKFEAERIFWHAKVDFAKLFKRTYWFRVSDGVYIKQEGSSNRTRVFVKQL